MEEAWFELGSECHVRLKTERQQRACKEKNDISVEKNDKRTCLGNTLISD